LADIKSLTTFVHRTKARLLQRRAELSAELAQIDKALAVLGGAATPAAKAPRQKPTVAPKHRVDGRSGPRPGMTLGNVMEKILRDKGEPMQVKDIVAAVMASDYPSKSKHLRSMANQTLSNDKRFRKVDRGMYTVA